MLLNLQFTSFINTYNVKLEGVTKDDVSVDFNLFFLKTPGQLASYAHGNGKWKWKMGHLKKISPFLACNDQRRNSEATSDKPWCTPSSSTR